MDIRWLFVIIFWSSVYAMEKNNARTNSWLPPTVQVPEDLDVIEEELARFHLEAPITSPCGMVSKNSYELLHVRGGRLARSESVPLRPAEPVPFASPAPVLTSLHVLRARFMRIAKKRYQLYRVASVEKQELVKAVISPLLAAIVTTVKATSGSDSLLPDMTSCEKK